MNGVANGVYGGDLPNQINTPWIDFSEQSTIVGWSSFTNKVLKYKVIGNICFFTISISGTSNSTTTSITSPFTLQNQGVAALAYTIDNGTNGISGFARLGVISANIIDFYRISGSNFSNTWTASGTKGIFGNFFIVL